MGGREYQVSRIQQDSREKKERKKGKEKEEEERVSSAYVSIYL
jgi:hypothetical protein